jgi:hypothetical protein
VGEHQPLGILCEALLQLLDLSLNVILRRHATNSYTGGSIQDASGRGDVQI